MTTETPYVTAPLAIASAEYLDEVCFLDGAGSKLVELDIVEVSAGSGDIVAFRST